MEINSSLNKTDLKKNRGRLCSHCFKSYSQSLPPHTNTVLPPCSHQYAILEKRDLLHTNSDQLDIQMYILRPANLRCAKSIARRQGPALFSSNWLGPPDKQILPKLLTIPLISVPASPSAFCSRGTQRDQFLQQHHGCPLPTDTAEEQDHTGGGEVALYDSQVYLDTKKVWGGPKLEDQGLCIMN